MATATFPGIYQPGVSVFAQGPLGPCTNGVLGQYAWYVLNFLSHVYVRVFMLRGHK